MPVLLLVLLPLAGCGEAARRADGPDRATAAPATAAGSDRVVVRGVVRDPRGTVLAGCQVGATSQTPGISAPEMASISGPDGSWVWTLPAGTFTFAAACPSAGAPREGAVRDVRVVPSAGTPVVITVR